MADPPWPDNDPADTALAAANCAAIAGDLALAAADRELPNLRLVQGWHRRIYAGCNPPVACYVGNFRGDARYPELVDHEVGVGPLASDGFPAKMGLWSRDLAPQLDRFEGGLQRGVAILDNLLPVGTRPSTVDELHHVVRLVAEVHGEWVRLHPFVNGNGRTARLLAAFLSLRYGLPVFVQLRPRPADVAYARAAQRSMGRAPDFAGDHGEATAVFTHMLSLTLLP